MNGDSTIDFRTLRDLLPTQAEAIARLEHLCTHDGPPVVAVLGKYNHGKSSLLNALVGEDRFKVSDARETTRVASLDRNGVRWMDTPGLDADVAGEDDRLAYEAACTQADVRLFVHTLKEGELDAAELALARRLHAQEQAHGRALFTVLTQLDQVANDTERNRIVAVIERQMPGVTLVPVSAACYVRGSAEGKPALVKLSRFTELQSRLHTAIAATTNARERELDALIDTLAAPLADDVDRAKAHLHAAETEARRASDAFQADLARVQARIERKFAEI